MNPELYAEMNLVFSESFDMSSISRLTGIYNAEIHPLSNKLSPLTNKPVDGSWSIQTSHHNTFDLSVVLSEMIQLVSPHLTVIKDICDKYNGEVNFCIVASFCSESTPALYFERDFLDVANMLKATIQIDMYPD